MSKTEKLDLETAKSAFSTLKNQLDLFDKMEFPELDIVLNSLIIIDQFLTETDMPSEIRNNMGDIKKMCNYGETALIYLSDGGYTRMLIHPFPLTSNKKLLLVESTMRTKEKWKLLTGGII